LTERSCIYNTLLAGAFFNFPSFERIRHHCQQLAFLGLPTRYSGDSADNSLATRCMNSVTQFTLSIVTTGKHYFRRNLYNLQSQADGYSREMVSQISGTASLNS